MNFDPEIEKRIAAWQKAPFDEETQKAVKDLAENDPKGAEDAFYTLLTFGTGGLRGIMGPGTNRMNRYTVRMATQGLANYLLQHFSQANVVIGFDSRNRSEEFAKESARVLAANSIHVYLIKELRPTPYISFACREKKCQAAINITASHNAAIYNGYKVYWADGGQIVPPHDTGIIDEVKKITDLSQVKVAAINDPHIELIESDFDEKYYQAIHPLQLFPKENQEEGSTLKITFTPVHGTGITLLPEALKRWGFTNLNIVKAQIHPDGDFPTVKVPNPEFKETLQLGIDQMLQTESNILLATDPDADRLAIVVNQQGVPHILSGNQIAELCTHYICEVLSKKGTLPKNGAFVTTIVSTDLVKVIAEAHQMICFEVLTGFKYIAEKILQWEEGKGNYHFLFGAEESYGYLVGTYARDKDAVSASCFLTEIALWAKKQGMTLLDMLHDIYTKYGVFLEKQLAINFEPTKAGMEKMKSLMAELRNNLPKTFCGQTVEIIEDYKTRKRHNLKTKKEEPLTLPISDVLLFRLADQTKVVIRPSGTEPKIKIYAGVRQKEFTSVEAALKSCDTRIDELLSTAKQDLSG